MFFMLFNSGTMLSEILFWKWVDIPMGDFRLIILVFLCFYEFVKSLYEFLFSRNSKTSINLCFEVILPNSLILADSVGFINY